MSQGKWTHNSCGVKSNYGTFNRTWKSGSFGLGQRQKALPVIISRSTGVLECWSRARQLYASESPMSSVQSYIRSALVFRFSNTPLLHKCIARSRVISGPLPGGKLKPGPEGLDSLSFQKFPPQFLLDNPQSICNKNLNDRLLYSSDRKYRQNSSKGKRRVFKSLNHNS